jgi:hypothetical protein
MGEATINRLARRLGLLLVYAAVAGLFVGLLGPFGNYEHGSLAQRLTYWVGMMLVGSLMLEAAILLGERLAPPRTPPWLAAVIAILVACVPLAFLSRTVAVSIWPILGSLLGPGDWYLQTVVLTVPLGGVYWWLSRRSKPAPPGAEPSSAASGAALRDAICLQMEDHYVRVHTAKGSHLVLMRLSDAIGRVGAEGLQVHRSWWVAKRAVETAIVDGRNVRLRLVNGLEAPVARTAVAKVREAGLLV